MLLYILVETHGGPHINVQPQRHLPPIYVDQGLADSRMLPAVMQYGLEQRPYEGVLQLLHGLGEPLGVAQLDVPLLPEKLHKLGHRNHVDLSVALYIV